MYNICISWHSWVSFTLAIHSSIFILSLWSPFNFSGIHKVGISSFLNCICPWFGRIFNASPKSLLLVLSLLKFFIYKVFKYIIVLRAIFNDLNRMSILLFLIIIPSPFQTSSQGTIWVDWCISITKNHITVLWITWYFRINICILSILTPMSI